MTVDPLRSHIRDWQEMAAADPCRAISGQKKRWEMEEFFATAQPHMDRLFSVASSVGLPEEFGCALEFGCGIGRFLPHFKQRFNEVWGVDLSKEMLDLAARYNPKCKFHLNLREDLAFFNADQFDLVYSFLVLQHLPDSATILGYIREFARILRPGGLAAFQVPSRLNLRWRIQPRRRLYQVLHSFGVAGERLQSWGLLPMRLTAVCEETVRSALAGAGCRLVQTDLLDQPQGMMYYYTK